MADRQGFSRYQQGVVKRYYENRDTMAIQKLGEMVSDLFLCQDPKKADGLWDRVVKALAHTDAQKHRVEEIVVQRDVAGLSQLVTELATPDRLSPPASPTASAPSSQPPAAHATQAPASSSPPLDPLDPLDPQSLKRAMKAFRKRLKLTRLDEESKLGVGPLTGGKRSGVVAITPPNQYPPVVWEELVKQGKLKRAGRGFYGLAQE